MAGMDESGRGEGATAGAPAEDAGAGGAALQLREIFWQNVLREALVSLPAAAAERPELLDGRFAILTRAGERIAVKAIRPLLAVSLPETDEDLAMSQILQCTVFQVLTPAGEEYTLPLHEIRALHSVSEDLAAELERQAQRLLGTGAEREPFGFAAYKAMVERRRARRARAEGAD